MKQTKRKKKLQQSNKKKTPNILITWGSCLFGMGRTDILWSMVWKCKSGLESNVTSIFFTTNKLLVMIKSYVIDYVHV